MQVCYHKKKLEVQRIHPLLSHRILTKSLFIVKLCTNLSNPLQPCHVYDEQGEGQQRLCTPQVTLKFFMPPGVATMSTISTNVSSFNISGYFSYSSVSNKILV